MKSKLFSYATVSLFSILLLAGCSSALSNRDEYLATYQHGDLVKAESVLDKTIDKEMPQRKISESNDAVWLLLDRATTRFARGDTRGAVDDYQLALEAIDYYNQDSSAEAVGQTLLQDEVSGYAGADYEQILARLYFALALLQQGDENNGLALLRQSEGAQQVKREKYARTSLTRDYQLIDNAVAKYLFAALLEKQGDLSNAAILYRQVGMLVGQDLVVSDLERLAAPRSDRATIIVLSHNGNVPYKIPGTSVASVASAIALEIFLSTQKIDPAWSSLTGIPVPILCQHPFSIPRPVFATIDGIRKPLSLRYDVAATAKQQLDQQMPVIVARGVARFLLRRGALAFAQKQDNCLGAICDLGLLVANACTKADTRSWTTLPSALDLTRYELSPGKHTISIRIESFNGHSMNIGEYQLQLEPYSFCVINVFNIHPGISTIQIPNRFLIN